MANLAATRSAFISVTYDTCLYSYYDCFKKRDTGLAKRDTATYGYLDTMSASAGLSGLETYISLHPPTRPSLSESTS